MNWIQSTNAKEIGIIYLIFICLSLSLYLYDFNMFQRLIFPIFRISVAIAILISCKFKFNKFTSASFFNTLFVVVVIALRIIVKIFYMPDSLWCANFILGFVISFVVSILKNKKDNKKDTNNTKDTKDTKMFFISYIRDIVKFIKKFILKVTILVSLFTVADSCFGIFKTICEDPTDSGNNSDGGNNDQNKGPVTNIEKDKGKTEDNSDTSNLSLSAAKRMITDAVQGAVEVMGNAVPTLIGGMAGANMGKAMIKFAGKLPPIQKGAFWVGTAIVGSLALTVATVFGK